MPFDETHTSKPQTAHDIAVDAEKRRKIREYQRPFIEAVHRRQEAQSGVAPASALPDSVTISLSPSSVT